METSDLEKNRMVQTKDHRFQDFKHKSEQDLHKRSSSFDTKLKQRRDLVKKSFHKRNTSTALNDQVIDKTALVRSRSPTIGIGKIDVVDSSSS